MNPFSRGSFLAGMSIRSLVIGAGCIGAIGIGLIGLAGWVLDLPTLKSIHPGAVEMKVNTSLGLLTASLVLLRIHLLPGRTIGLSRVLAFAVAALGVATLSEYVFDYSLGIGELFFADTGTAFNAARGRMSPYSTVAFIAIGVALYALTTRRRKIVACLGAGIALVIGLVSIGGYAWNSSELIADQRLPPVAVHTAVAFVCVGSAVLLMAMSRAVRKGPPAHQVIYRHLCVGFAGTLILLATAGGYTYRAAVDYGDAAAATAHAQTIQIALTHLRAGLHSTESTHSNHVLTGATVELDKHKTSRLDIAAAQEELGALLTEPGQQRRFANLRTLVAQRLASFDTSLLEYGRSGLLGAAAAIAESDGISLHNAAHALLDEMDEAEDVTLESHVRTRTLEQRQALFGAGAVLSVAAIGFVVLFSGVRRALRMQARTENELRAREEQLAVTLDSIGDAVLTTNAEGRITQLNPVAESLTGWTTTEARDRPVTDVLQIVNDTRRELADALVADTLAHGTVHGLANEHTILIARDGTERPIGDSCAPIRDRTNQVVGAVLVFRDLSQEYAARKRIEQAQEELRAFSTELEHRVETRTRELAQSQQQFADLFESAPDALIVIDANGDVVMVNERAVDLFGWSQNELIGQSVDILVPEEARAKHEGVRQEYVREGDESNLMAAGRRPYAIRRDGTPLQVEVGLSRLRTADRSLTLAAVRDVTERVRLEEQLQRAQRMETIGQLAGGVAHDFNNWVTVINNTAELATQTLQSDDPLREEFRTIRDAGLSAAILTRQLLAFGRRQILRPVVVDLRTLMVDLEPMMRLIGEHIAISVSNCSAPATVKVDPGQIKQVVLNLATNSRDAISAEGTLRIDVDTVELKLDDVRVHAGLRPGPYVRLSVSDSGAGIEAATLEHIFEPFFTTKNVGKGTGLGLSTAYGIIKQSGGDISVDSEVGHGTTFKVYLPHVVGVDVGRKVHKSRVAGGTETILLVEDNASVRRVARRMCESAGYRVLDTSNGDEALRALKQADRAVDLLITDIVMPGIGGRELAERVRGVQPGVRVLFTSGYTNDAIFKRREIAAGAPFLTKPYSSDDLKRKIREVLDQGNKGQ